MLAHQVHMVQHESINWNVFVDNSLVLSQLSHSDRTFLATHFWRF